MGETSTVSRTGPLSYIIEHDHLCPAFDPSLPGCGANHPYTPFDLAALVNRLNLGDLNSLAAEWEICILLSLMNLGRTTYEPALAGKSHPDFHFVTSHDVDLQFIADVTLISNSCLEENNPIWKLSRLLYAKAHKLGIPGTFSYRVGSSSIGRRGAFKVQLSIPHKRNLQAFVERHIVPQLRIIARNPNQSSVINVAERPWDLTLLYAPAQRYSHGSYRAFRNATMKDKIRFIMP